MGIDVYFRKNWGVSINEGYFPNLTIVWRRPRPFFYLGFTRRWKFIFGCRNLRFGPFGTRLPYEAGNG